MCICRTHLFIIIDANTSVPALPCSYLINTHTHITMAFKYLNHPPFVSSWICSFSHLYISFSFCLVREKKTLSPHSTLHRCILLSRRLILCSSAASSPSSSSLRTHGHGFQVQLSSQFTCNCNAAIFTIGFNLTLLPFVSAILLGLISTQTHTHTDYVHYYKISKKNESKKNPFCHFL